MSNIAYLSLGSNLGDRFRNLREAVRLLQKHRNIEIKDISSIYETDPVGYTDQDPFLNIAIKVSTNLKPEELLRAVHFIENQLGRTREIHWGPRTIDLDILLYNQENIETESLIIPHPRMLERAFVLIPLVEIHGELDNRISQLQIQEMKRREGVAVWKQRSGEDVFALFAN